MIIYLFVVFIVVFFLLVVYFLFFGIDFKGGVVVIGEGISVNFDQLEKELSGWFGIEVYVESFISVSGLKGIRVYVFVGIDF